MSKENYVTPPGELKWVNITGQGKENYNQDGYEYVATIKLSGEHATNLIEKIDEVTGPIPAGKTKGSARYKQLYKNSEGELYTVNEEVEGRSASDGKPTDSYEFTFATNVVFPDGRPTKIGVYNAAAKKIDLGDRLIGNGTIGAISGQIKQYTNGKRIGASLYLKSIQIIKFEEYSGDAGFESQDGDFEGFVDEESGFATQAEDNPPKKKKPKL